MLVYLVVLEARQLNCVVWDTDHSHYSMDFLELRYDITLDFKNGLKRVH